MALVVQDKWGLVRHLGAVFYTEDKTGRYWLPYIGTENGEGKIRTVQHGFPKIIKADTFDDALNEVRSWF